MTTTTGGGGDSDDDDERRATGGDDGIEWRAAMFRERLETKWGDETEIFVSAIYIGWAFSTGSWLQPVLKAYFCQAKRRETKAFSTGWSHQPVLKGGPLVPVGATNRY